MAKLTAIFELKDRISQRIEQITGKTKLLERTSARLNASYKRTGELMTKVAVGGAVALGTAIVGVGAASINAAMQLDDAYDSIQIGTGASGKALDSLNASFDKVAKTVPDAFEKTAQTLAGFNTRTGATGTVLENLTRSALGASRMLKEDTNTVVASSTRLMGDWSVSANKGSEMMDKLFVTSQQTGIGMSALADKMVQFGAPLRQMGFDFNTSVALMGKWEKEGVNAELVLGSLRIALTKMAKKGVSDPAAGLQKMVTQIKNAGSAGKANALAMQMFGSRAGPDMAAAIREGRFEIGNLINKIQNSKGAILSTQKATDGFAERWQVAKNRMMIALNPIGMKILDLADKVMPYLENGIGKINGVIEKYGPKISSGIDTAFGTINKVFKYVKTNADIIVPALIAVGIVLLTTLIPSLISAAGVAISTVIAFMPMITMLAVVGAAVAGLAYMWKHNMGGIKDKTKAVGTFIVGVWNKIKAYFASIMPSIMQIVTPVWQIISSLVKHNLTVVWQVIKVVFTTAWSIVKLAMNGIWNILKITFGLIGGIVKAGLQILTGDFSGAWKTIKKTAGSSISGIKELFNDFIGDATGVGKTFVKGLKDGFIASWDSLKTTAKDIWNSITSIFEKKVTVDVGINLNTPKGFSGWDDFWNSKIMYDSDKGFYIQHAKKLDKKAIGGIVNKPVIAGEAGAEAIIPLSNHRGRAISLWEKTGKMLGLNKKLSTQEAESFGSGTISSSKSVDNRKSVNIEKLIENVHVHNEADENRLIAKIKALLDEQLNTSPDGVYA